ncbi:hypothetical protein [Vibrio anguillarum]|uniref:hypothetical protein n=2 Tax=Vibrio anguillarum TaxID=55601 RepID=UPI00188BF705|nr:hypothetical protein [Vibrio anguillarum]
MVDSTSIELAYDYAKVALEQELKRFDSLDNKANKFLGLISVALGLLVSVIGWGFDKYFPPETASQCWIVFIMFLTIFGLVLAWSHLFQSIRVAAIPSLKLDNSVCKKLCSDDSDKITLIIETYHDLLQRHKEAMITKESFIEKSYRCISFSGVLILVLLFSIMISQL